MATLTVDDRGIVSSCPDCGRPNRIAFERLDQAVRCGQCKHALSAPSVPIEIASTADFDRVVARASIPVVVDYWAPWCGPCRMVAPELAKVAARTAGRYLVVKVNTDALADIGERFNIRSIPTLGIFAGGREVTRTTGARPADEIERFVAQAVAATAERHAG